jgi:hypothetical protein
MTATYCLDIVSLLLKHLGTEVLPLIWVNNPSIEAIKTRRLIPAVRNMSIQLFLACAISRATVDWICAISALTKRESASPSAWYLTRIAKASSWRSLEQSHLGDSGSKLGIVSRAFPNGSCRLTRHNRSEEATGMLAGDWAISSSSLL